MTITVAQIRDQHPRPLVTLALEDGQRCSLDDDAFRCLFGFAPVELERYEMLAEPIPTNLPGVLARSSGRAVTPHKLAKN